MQKPLTKKEQQFWERYIEWYFDHLQPPNVYDLARYMHKSPQLIQYYISALRRKGWIKSKRPNK